MWPCSTPGCPFAGLMAQGKLLAQASGSFTLQQASAAACLRPLSVLGHALASQGLAPHSMQHSRSICSSTMIGFAAPSGLDALTQQVRATAGQAGVCQPGRQQVAGSRLQAARLQAARVQPERVQGARVQGARVQATGAQAAACRWQG